MKGLEKLPEEGMSLAKRGASSSTSATKVRQHWGVIKQLVDHQTKIDWLR